MDSPRVALGSRTLARAPVAASTQELAKARSSAGWALLSPPSQARVEALLSGNTPISDEARSALSRQGASWAEMPAESQQQFLSKLLGSDFRPGFVREYAPPLSTAPARFTCAPMTSEPWQQFQGRPADIQRTTLRFGKHDILYREPVTLEPGVVQHSREQVTQALAQLPRFLREAVSIVAVSPFTNVRTTPDGKQMPVYMEAFPGIVGVNDPTIVIYAQSEPREARGLTAHAAARDGSPRA
ncbi:MAG: hypothetical protein IPJ65_43490, partial [Archangiaceae bacterium]|nr:hypothetical protein [Archangiaceae bacterium]